MPAGATSIDFPVSIRPYEHDVSASISAYRGVSRELKLLLLTGPLSLLPKWAEPGRVVTGILLLPAPAAAAGVVAVSDDAPGRLSYTPSVPVAAGQRVVTFPIRVEPGAAAAPLP